jgi:hypothetical protein
MVATRDFSARHHTRHFYGMQSYGSIISAKYSSLARQKQKYRGTKEDLQLFCSGLTRPSQR